MATPTVEPKPTSGPGSRGSIERGASWSSEETRLLLRLWGEDLVRRQMSNCKRTRHVWQQIAQRINQQGFDRTPGKLHVACTFRPGPLISSRDTFETLPSSQLGKTTHQSIRYVCCPNTQTRCGRGCST